MKTVYKVVDWYYRSCVTETNALNYAIGSTVTPTIKNSKIFVFDNLKSAQDFSTNWGGSSRILRCSTKSAIKTQPFTMDDIFVNGKRSCGWTLLAKARKQKKSIAKTFITFGYSQLPISYWPKGTLWCDEVTVIEEIK